MNITVYQHFNLVRKQESRARECFGNKPLWVWAACICYLDAVDALVVVVVVHRIVWREKDPLVVYN